MSRIPARMRQTRKIATRGECGKRLFLFSNLKWGEGVDTIVDFIATQGGLHPWTDKPAGLPRSQPYSKFACRYGPQVCCTIRRLSSNIAAA